MYHLLIFYSVQFTKTILFNMFRHDQWFLGNIEEIMRKMCLNR